MSNTHNIPQSESTREAESDGRTIRPNIEWPVEVWKAVKIAAIQADATSPGQYVVDTMAQHIGLKAA